MRNLKVSSLLFMICLKVSGSLNKIKQEKNIMCVCVCVCVSVATTSSLQECLKNKFLCQHLVISLVMSYEMSQTHDKNVTLS